MEYYGEDGLKNVLSHHGILGMKWGNKNGPPYPLGVGDHSASEKKEGWRKSLGGGRNEGLYDRKDKKTTSKAQERRAQYASDVSKSYQKSLGLTKEEADNLTKEVGDLTKKVAIGVGVAAGTAAVVYAARIYGRNYVDDVIKAGTTLQTLDMNPDRLNMGEAFYTAYREADKKKYIGLFSKDKFGNTKTVINADVAKDLRIASTKNAEKVFNKLIKQDENFASYAKRLNDANGGSRKRMYETFNSINPIRHDENSEKYAKQFYDELKKLGYAGVHDINDRKNSGFNTKAVIMFDRSEISNIRTRDLDPKEIQKGMQYSLKAITVDKLTDPKTVAIGSLYAGLYGIAVGTNNAEIKAKQKHVDNLKKKKSREIA